MLCLTFIDTAVLYSNYPKQLYINIILYSISSSASKYKKVIKPLMYFNAEFSIFLIIYKSPEACKSICLKYGLFFIINNVKIKLLLIMTKEDENKIKNEKQILL